MLAAAGLGGDVFISEFLAANRAGLRDGENQRPDWIEIHNRIGHAVALAGWHLTDDPGDLGKWTFPSATLAPGGFLVVFASGRNEPDSAGNLHTNFQLDAEGEYLALVEPDGVTIASEFGGGFPAQFEDRSYGSALQAMTRQLVSAASAARVLVTTSANASTLGTRWTGGEEPFDDSAWATARAGIGFDAAATNAPVEVALGKPVMASGPTWPSLVQEHLTDGNLATFTHNNTPERDFAYTVDLGAVYTIEHLEIYNRADGCCPDRLSNYTVSIHAGDDLPLEPSEWAAALRADGSDSGVGGWDLVTPDLDPTGTFAGRWIKLQARPDSDDRYFQVAELRAWAFAGGSGYAAYYRHDLAPTMRGWSASAFMRVPFLAANLPEITRLTLRLRYDDGFIAWVNGVEVARRNARLGGPRPDGEATDFHSGARVEEFVIPVETLRDGRNTLAFQALNVTPGDRDFLLVPELTAHAVTVGPSGYFKQPTPRGYNGAAVAGFVDEPTFSKPRGFYEALFELVVACPTPGATLVYTTNGVAPALSNGIVVLPVDATSFAQATIHLATTTIVRAACFKTDYEPSTQLTHSYVFLGDVLRQPKSPAGFPATWNGAPADYEMDPRVVTNVAYRNEIKEGLRAIPTLSLVLDPEDLFGSQRGIYTFSERSGDAWERPVSVELIRPDGTTGFQVNAGIRIWGTGWRPHSASLKHAFQLKFQDQYGPRRLEYPMFPHTAQTSFDNLVLRAQGSRSWNDFRQPDIEQTQYIHDAWCRDTCRAMGKTDGDATFVHLYLNGLYWGLYNPVEKTDASFAADYFGGEKEDYDVVTARFIPEADAGDLEAWNTVMSLANAGLASAAAYARLQDYVDVDDLIDYMLVNQYATNHDGPPASGNNVRASRRRSPDGRFRFFVWDMEYTFWDARENNLGGDVDNNPTRIFQRLLANPEFRVRYADHVHRHLFNDGALTAEAARQRWLARAGEIYLAVLGESARWGDARRPALPYTRDVEWQRELDRLLTQFFPVRTQILLDQLRAANLYPKVVAPAFSPHGGKVPPGYELQISAPAGVIYYTLDGTDPRLAGGDVAPSAQTDAGSPRRITVKLTESRRVLARSRVNGDWSALNDAGFTVELPLALTELMYHPPPQTAAEWVRAGGQGFEADDYEFIELQNISPTFPISLRGLRFADGVILSLPETTLAPLERVVVVRNRAAFENRYGTAIRVVGSYGNPDNPDLDYKLANDGERLLWVDAAGGVALDFSYDDAWQPGTDGRGASLELVDLLGNRNEAGHWRASPTWGGTPGAASVASSVEIQEVAAMGDQIELRFIAEAGLGYAVEYRASLTDDSWRVAHRVAPGPRGAMTSVSLPRPPGAGSGFYRLVVP